MEGASWRVKEGDCHTKVEEAILEPGGPRGRLERALAERCLPVYQRNLRDATGMVGGLELPVTSSSTPPG